MVLVHFKFGILLAVFGHLCFLPPALLVQQAAGHDHSAHLPSRSSAMYSLDSSTAADDASVAAIIDAEPIEVMPAAASVDANDDDEPSGNDNKASSSVWPQQRPKFARRPLAAAPPPPPMMHFIRTFSVERRRRKGGSLPAAEAAEPEGAAPQANKAVAQPIRKMEQSFDDGKQPPSEERTRRAEATDEYDDDGAANAHLLAEEDVDRGDGPSSLSADSGPVVVQSDDDFRQPVGARVRPRAYGVGRAPPAPSSSSSSVEDDAGGDDGTKATTKEVVGQPTKVASGGDGTTTTTTIVDHSDTDKDTPPEHLATTPLLLSTTTTTTDDHLVHSSPPTNLSPAASSPMSYGAEDPTSASSSPSPDDSATSPTSSLAAATTTAAGLSEDFPTPAEAIQSPPMEFALEAKATNNKEALSEDKSSERAKNRKNDRGGGDTKALSELDLKSDRALSKLMRRTTVRMRDYPSEAPHTTTATTRSPFVVGAQLAASQAPSLFPGILGGVPYGAPLPQASYAAASADGGHSPTRAQSSRRHHRPEQFEQLGCGWDLLTQTCKDVFRVGWCEHCADFGGPFLHDCRCMAVTGLYVQTASFLGSAAASARASAANRTAAGATPTAAHGVVPLPLLPAALPPLLPTLAQLGASLEQQTAGTPAATTTLPAENQMLADAFRLLPSMPLATLPGFGGPPSTVQQQQQQPVQAVVAPFLAPPSSPALRRRSLGGVAQFTPEAAPIALPQLGAPFGAK